ncbi:hypothetical protein [Streptomyces sp. NPDC002426]
MYSTHELSEMTHRTGPWVEARGRAQAPDLERSNEPLLDEDIADFFGALAEHEKHAG